MTDNIIKGLVVHMKVIPLNVLISMQSHATTVAASLFFCIFFCLSFSFTNFPIHLLVVLSS